MTDEALEILNWTQRKTYEDLWMIKVSYVTRAGSATNAKPVSKTVFMNPQTDKTKLLIKLSSMMDATLNKKFDNPAEEGQRLYHAQINLNNSLVIKKEDNNVAKWYDFLENCWNGADDGYLLLFVCREGWGETGWNRVLFYTTWKEMVDSNSNPQSMIIKIKKVNLYASH